ncbi:MAG TPA: ATP-binding protein [Candidatus Paceibacterota bacterium]
MSSNIHLLIFDILGVFSALVIVVLGTFVLLKDHRKTVNVTLGLTFTGAIIGIVTYIIGVNVADSGLSHDILMWNVSIIAVSVINFHCAMAILNKQRAEKPLIAFVYIIGIMFLGIFLLQPWTFIGDPVPKMYFPNYFTPGPLHLPFNIIFKLIIPGYLIGLLWRGSRTTEDALESKRLLFFALSFAVAWLVGTIPTLLTYDIRFDPVWGTLFPIIFAVPFIYAVVRYELLDIKIVAKRAVAYATIVIGVGCLVGFFDFMNALLRSSHPSFPIWAMPLILALVLVGIGVFIWRQLREGEILKYEFITTVTHKFRTPLTHIKWANENIKGLLDTMPNKDTAAGRDVRDQLGYIEGANSKLVELTDILANTSDDGDFYRYKIVSDDLSAFAREVIRSVTNHAAVKKITVVEKIDPEVRALFDSSRLKFVVQTFIENGINYTPENGRVTVTVKTIVVHGHREAVCSVTDSGIGITRDELPRIATKLYRGRRARTTDTEGMGIGLYVSKGIVERHRGRLLVESEGEGKGATFSFYIPAA